MFKLPHNCTHFTLSQGNAQNPSSQALIVCEPRTCRCTSWIQKRQRKQRSNFQHSLDLRKKQQSSRKTSTSASLTLLKLLTVWIRTNWKILKKMGIPDHLTCLLRNLYAGQEATVRMGHGTTDWFKIGKRVYLAIYGHPAYLPYMQSTSQEMPVWMNHKLESRLLGEISTTSDMQMIPL